MERDEAVEIAKRFLKNRGETEMPLVGAESAPTVWRLEFDNGKKHMGLPPTILLVYDDGRVAELCGVEEPQAIEIAKRFLKQRGMPDIPLKRALQFGKYWLVEFVNSES